MRLFIYLEKSLVFKVCDVIIVKAKDSLEFIKHLTVANLFKAEKYLMYSKTFPLQYFQLLLNVAHSLIQKGLKLNLIFYCIFEMTFEF